MSTWNEAINLYKCELLKTRGRHEKQLKQFKKRLHKMMVAKSTILLTLNNEIRSLRSQIKTHTEAIETHNTLIEETENGTLDEPGSDSD